VGKWDSGKVRQRDSLRLSAIGCPLSAAIACRTVFPKAGGSGACGVRVLSFVRFAPNDGFRPQSGLVQRGVIKNAVCVIINAAFGSAAAVRHIYLLPRSGNPQPSEPFEPSRRRRVQWAPPQPSAQRAVKPKNPPAKAGQTSEPFAPIGRTPLRPPPKSAIILHIYISQLSSVNQL
jgi:hypothetical protein